MRTRYGKVFIPLVLLGLVLAGCGGLAGEPDIIATLPPQPSAAPARFDAPVSLAAGADIFAQQCTRCHGDLGAGDGEFVQTGQIEAITDMTDLATAHGQTPQQWYNTITEGRIEMLMPPWRDALTEAERWNVALYTYTLAYTPEMLALGETVWAAECATCHGETGAGDGEMTDRIDAPDLTTPHVDASDAQWTQLVVNGSGAMPGFDELSQAEVNAVVAYTRTLSLNELDAPDAMDAPDVERVEGEPAAPVEGPAVAAAESAPAEAPAADSAALPVTDVVGTISGTIDNATAGADIPVDAELTLHILNENMEEILIDGTINPDGTFLFDDVPVGAELGYFVTVFHADGYFSSDFVRGDVENPDVELPITVVEMTTDSSVLSISEMVMQYEVVGDNVQVVQLVTFENDSDRMFLSEMMLTDQIHASVMIPLPEGARVMETEQMRGRFVVAENTLIDTRPVYPEDSHVVHVIYQLPLTAATTMTHRVNYPVSGAVQVFAPEQVTITGEQTPYVGPQDFNGIIYDVYGMSLALDRGDTVSYGVSVAPPETSFTAGFFNERGQTLALILSAAGVLMASAGVALFIKDRRDTRQQMSNDDLVAAIAALDQLHAGGEITEKRYQKRRAALKQQLAQRLQGDEADA